MSLIQVASLRGNCSGRLFAIHEVRQRLAANQRLRTARIVFALFAALFASAALAQSYTYLGKFGSAGGADGQFGGPGGVAIDPTTRNIVVTDLQSARVQIFDSNGNYLSKFGSPGCGTGQFYSAYGVAIDPATHNIFVAAGVCGRILIFSSAGSYIGQFGTYGFGNGQFQTPSAVAVDPTTRNIVVADRDTNHVQIFNSAGVFLTQVGTPNNGPSPGTGNGQFNSPMGVAIDPTTHNIIVADSQSHRVQIFNSAGVYLSQFGSAGSGDGQFTFPVGVAIDPATRNIVVADYGVGRVQVFSSTGLYISQFASFGTGNGQFENPYGAAIDPATRNVVIADQNNHRVQIFAPTGGTPPPQCTYSLSAAFGSSPAAGGTSSVTVNSVNGCAWTAASNVSWIRVISGASGSGTGDVSYTVDANSGGQRTGTITIAGQIYTVIQAGGASSAPPLGLGGNAGYNINEASVTITIDTITNRRSSTTGTLRLEVWALTTAYTGTGGSGYKIAQTGYLNPLAANSSYTNVSRTVSLLATPPSGTWYLVLFLTEYTAASYNDGFVITDWVNFATLWTTTAPTFSLRSDCFFNWAERNYPTLFSPLGTRSNVYESYYYRYYMDTGAYLATVSANNHVYYFGPATNPSYLLLDLGVLSDWGSITGCQ